MMEKKKCRKCGMEKPLDEFGKNQYVADGHDSQCRSCKSAYQKELRLRLKKSANGNGKRKQIVPKVPRVRRPASPAMPVDAIYLPPEAIKAIKKSVAMDVARDFQKFLEEKYA